MRLISGEFSENAFRRIASYILHPNSLKLDIFQVKCLNEMATVKSYIILDFWIWMYIAA
jgi:hypothetical protein